MVVLRSSPAVRLAFAARQADKQVQMGDAPVMKKGSVVDTCYQELYISNWLPAMAAFIPSCLSFLVSCFTSTPSVWQYLPSST